MRLPQIQNKTGVRSLGRWDTSLPVKTARAETQALLSTTNNIYKWAEAEDAKNVAESIAEYNREVERLALSLQRGETIDLNEHPDIEVDVPEDQIQYVKDKDGREHRYVPTHMAITPIFDARMAELRAEFNERGMSGQGRRQFNYKARQTDHAANMSVIKTQFDGKRRFLSAGFKKAYQEYIYQGDAQGARETAEAALATGVWPIEDFQKAVETMDNDLAQAMVEQSMATTDPEALYRLSVEVYDPRLKLTPTQRSDAAVAAHTKALAMEDRNYKLGKRQRKDNSEKLQADYMRKAFERGEAYTMQEMAELTRNLEKTEIVGLNAFNNTLRSEMNKQAVEGDPAAYNQGMMAVMSLAYPSDTSMAGRRVTVMATLAELAGCDPLTGEVVGPAKISATQYQTLYNMMNNVQRQPFQNPEIVKFVDDKIYKLLTGASKDNAGYDSRTAEDVAAAASAEYDLYEAARSQGAAFDVKQWWQDNKDKYLTDTARKNIHNAARRRVNHIKGKHRRQGGGFDTKAMATEFYDTLHYGDTDSEEYKLAIEAINEATLSNERLAEAKAGK